MALDFVGFINDNWSAPVAKKVALLNDFCAYYGYEETVLDPDGNPIPNPVSKQEFANMNIADYIRQSVNSTRLRVAVDAVVIDELVLE